MISSIYRYPVRSWSILTADTRGRRACVRQRGNTLFTINLLNMRDVRLIVMILAPHSYQYSTEFTSYRVAYTMRGRERYLGLVERSNNLIYETR